MRQGSGKEATMSTDERATASADLLDEQFLRDFTSRWHAAWNAYDPQQVAALCTDDVEWQQPSSPPLPRGYDGAALLVEVHVVACFGQGVRVARR